jgi:ubiquinone biosynthesis protein UbiJ
MARRERKHPYNPGMLQDWTSRLSALFAPAVQERLTLLLNHVLSREPVAQQRLKPHIGATILVESAGWPAFLPAPPPLALQITPAGLLERLAELPAAFPRCACQLDASNPAAMPRWAPCRASARGSTSRAMRRFATDMSWLIENLRWDIEDDLAQHRGQGARPRDGALGQGHRRGRWLRLAQDAVDRDGPGQWAARPRMRHLCPAAATSSSLFCATASTKWRWSA